MWSLRRRGSDGEGGVSGIATCSDRVSRLEPSAGRVEVSAELRERCVRLIALLGVSVPPELTRPTEVLSDSETS